MIWLVLLMALLQIADVLTTRAVLLHGGHERNPLVRKGIERFGFTGAMALKLLVAAVATAALYWTGLFWLLAALCALYAVVVVNNWRIARKNMT